MKISREILRLFQALTPLAWSCLLVWFVALVVTIYSWLPLEEHSDAVLIPMSIATMASMLAAFVAMAKRDRVARKVKVRLPLAYWLIGAVSLGYFLIVFFGTVRFYPQGVRPEPKIDLRVFSAFSLLLSIAAVGFCQSAAQRAREAEA